MLLADSYGLARADLGVRLCQFWILNFRFFLQSLRVTLLRTLVPTLVPRYRCAIANAALSLPQLLETLLRSLTLPLR
ncbi:hypothetical protein [Nostoc sp.]|uniref:hypothetical protein n=1 Tax=Nostoc sp. TaxID=1180 RepID=UPI002FF9D73C